MQKFGCPPVPGIPPPPHAVYKTDHGIGVPAPAGPILNLHPVSFHLSSLFHFRHFLSDTKTCCHVLVSVHQNYMLNHSISFSVIIVQSYYN